MQSFLADPLCCSYLRMDGLLAVIDAYHIQTYLDGTRAKDFSSTTLRGAHGPGLHEVFRQMTYADVVILNKIDLLSDEEGGRAQQIEELQRRLKPWCEHATLQTCAFGNLPMSSLLNLRCFDPSKWKSPDASWVWGDDSERYGPFQIRVDGSGRFAKRPLQHGDVSLCAETGSELSSICLSTTKELDLLRTTQWLRELLEAQGSDILRLKGYERQFIAQGVHMVFQGAPGISRRPSVPWNRAGEANEGRAEKSYSRLVLIGRNLNESSLQSAWRTCVT
eukprot:gene195-197_t